MIMDLSIACDPADELAPSHGLYDTLSSMRTPNEQTGGFWFFCLMILVELLYPTEHVIVDGCRKTESRISSCPAT
jgi:hypothetical protein